MKNTIKKNEDDVILDKIYDFSMRSPADCPVPFLTRLEIALYIIFSSRYAARYLRLGAVREILRSDFFPPVPAIKNSSIKNSSIKDSSIKDFSIGVSLIGDSLIGSSSTGNSSIGSSSIGSSSIEDSIMERINADAVEMLREEQNPAYAVSFRGWVITGFVVLVSLTTSLFGMDFVRMIPEVASSFLLPIGITIGVVVTVYGALFIGSHLKELSDRFRLH